MANAPQQHVADDDPPPPADDFITEVLIYITRDSDESGEAVA